MTPTSKISVRSLEVRDFSFVRELSSSQPNFTIPPPYVLWLLTRISPELCLVAEHADKGPLGYLLALPINNPPKSSSIGPRNWLLLTLIEATETAGSWGDSCETRDSCARQA